MQAQLKVAIQDAKSKQMAYRVSVSVNRWLIKLVGSSMSQSTDKNETTTGDSQQTVPTSELRAIIAEVLKNP